MDEGDARSELIRLAVRKIVEEALEAEVAEAVGRGYYENGAAPGAGYRNGYRRGRLRTAEGAIEYGVPQVADRTESFVSRVRAGLAGRTAELEQLAIEMYARGLSTRDIEAAFRDATGSSVLVLRPDQFRELMIYDQRIFNRWRYRHGDLPAQPPAPDFSTLQS